MWWCLAGDMSFRMNFSFGGSSNVAVSFLDFWRSSLWLVIILGRNYREVIIRGNENTGELYQAVRGAIG